MPTLIYSMLFLSIFNASQVLQVPLDLAGPQGAIVVSWTPALTKAPIFNHFLNAPGRVCLRNHYRDYQTPVLELTLGPGTHTCRSIPVIYRAGATYTIITFWRHVGGMMEMGIYLDGRIVGHTWEPAKPYQTWPAMTYIGARNTIPVSDPSFPGCAHIDGQMDIWVWR